MTTQPTPKGFKRVLEATEVNMTRTGTKHTPTPYLVKVCDYYGNERTIEIDAESVNDACSRAVDQMGPNEYARAALAKVQK